MATTGRTSPLLSRGRRNIPNQFNLLVTGHAHAGKSSFLRTLYSTLSIKKLHFNNTEDSNTGGGGGGGSSISSSSIPNISKTSTSSSSIPFVQGDISVPTPSLAKIEMEDDEGNRILLTLIDTPGLPIPIGVHKSNVPTETAPAADIWANLILKYVEDQYEFTLLEESKVRRNPKSPDPQVHVALYFFDPTVILACQGLTPMDVIALRRLTTRLNIIPCIAKSDLLTTRQISKLKNWISEGLKRYSIPTFAFPEDPDLEYDEETLLENEELRSLLPFSIINNEDIDETNTNDNDLNTNNSSPNNKKILFGREYPWGIVNIENPDHCDFLRIKYILFTSHLQELKSLTREEYYEQWRTDRLLEAKGVLESSTSSLSTTMSHPTTTPTIRNNNSNRNSPSLSSVSYSSSLNSTRPTTGISLGIAAAVTAAQRAPKLKDDNERNNIGLGLDETIMKNVEERFETMKAA